MRRVQFTVGQLIRSGSSNGAVTVLELDELGLVTVAKCVTAAIPQGIANTYAIGCELIDTITGAKFYNTSVASCQFNSAVIRDSANSLRTAINVGAANAGVTAMEFGDNRNHTTVLTVNRIDALTIVNSPTVPTASATGYLLYTFPVGVKIINSAYMSMAVILAENATSTANVGIGTILASGTHSTLGGVGAAAQNIIVGQTAANCSGTPTVRTAIPTAGVPLIMEVADIRTVHFNIAHTWAATPGTDKTGDIVGTVILNWNFVI